MDRLISERRRVEAALAVPAGLAPWAELGPRNVGGRMTAIVCHPQQPRLIWAGSAGGGVWKSADGGRTWRPLFHREDSLAIGALAIDPRQPDTLYVGTGEANLSADGYPGVGVYRTTSGGEGPAAWQLAASSLDGTVPPRISALAVDPADSTHLYLAGLSHGGRPDDAIGGLYVSTDSGHTWRREALPSASSYWCHAVVFHPTRAGVLFISIFARGSANGLWRSLDGGVSWTHLLTGLPSPDRLHRASLALSPSHPTVVYALIADARNEPASGDLPLLGVFRSDDTGDTWRDVTGGPLRAERQMAYNSTIAVHPTNPDHVLCGGVNLHRSLDGGGTWTQVTRKEAPPGSARYAHADHHALLMPTTQPGLVYDLNDGGLDVSEDGGEHWQNRSAGLVTTMFYDLDVAAADPHAKVSGGGAQDNGSLVTVSQPPGVFDMVSGSDGGWLAFDPADATRLYSSSQGMEFNRILLGGESRRLPTIADGSSVWMAILAIDPNRPQVLYAGSTRLWSTTDRGDHWSPVSPHFDGSVISAIEVAPDGRLYVGTENGAIARSDDAAHTWSGNLAGPTIPMFRISHLGSLPTAPATLFATVGNFGHRHVFRSADHGRTWEDVDRGRLPDVPHNSVSFDPDRPGAVYVASDLGVYASSDLGETWANLTGNLPNVPVIDLVFHRQTRTLTVATYGRGLWRLAVP